MALLTTRDVTGVDVEIHVDRNGTFTAIVKGEERALQNCRADKLEALIPKIRAALKKRKVEVEVPFRDQDGSRGVAYGRHGGNRKVLARIDGVAVQFDSYGTRADLFAPDTPDEVFERLADATRRERDAKREVDEIQKAHGFNLGAAVDRAIEEAASADERTAA
jgi:hypothetical protein